MIYIPKVKPVCATLLFLLFIQLGMWQIHRADEKKGMIAAENALAQESPIEFVSWSNLPKQYQRVGVKGRFLSQIMLLDNQHYQHQFGYDVLSILDLGNGNVVLVDRGWVLGDSSRRSFPNVTVPGAEIELQGSAYYPSKNKWLLGASIEKKEGVYILETIDTKSLSQVLQKKLYPFIIRLGANEANGFVRNWPIVSMPPERHIAYAVQWFALALTLLVLYVVLWFKKKHE